MTFTPEEAARMAEEWAQRLANDMFGVHSDEVRNIIAARRAIMLDFAQALRSRATPQAQEDAMRRALEYAKAWIEENVIEADAPTFEVIARIDAALSAKEGDVPPPPRSGETT